MTKQYDPMARAYEAHALDNAYNAHYDRPAVLSLLGDVRGLRVLDAGCGPGFYAEELVRCGARVVAVDSSSEMVALARRRLGGRAIVALGDLDRPLEFPDGSFDLVVCALVIHYLRDRSAAFREFHRVLGPSGRAVVSTQHPTADWLRKGGSYFDVVEEEDQWEREGETFPVRFWREPLTALCAAATDAGFLIERLLEPGPSESMRTRWPDSWEKLSREPGFLVLSLRKVP